MNDRPWHKRYHSDALTGYLVLSLEERGAYTTLLDLLYDRGRAFPDNDRLIAGYLGVSPRKARAIVQSLLDKGKLYRTDEGELSNRRFEKEMSSAEEIARKLAENGAKGGRTRAERAKNANENNGTVQAELKPIPEARSQTSAEPKGSTGADAPSAGSEEVIPTTKQLVWKHGRALLAAGGKSKDQAGRLLGKWVGAHGEAAVLEALDRCKREGALDPVAFIEGALKWRAKKAEAKKAPEWGEEFVTNDGRVLVWQGPISQWVESR